jgi:hypothetical protein
MRLPRWLRHWASSVLVFWSRIVGGVLHDYKNGKWEEICKWNTVEEENMAAEIIATMQMNIRDAIYITLTKVEGFGRGYFIVFDSRGHQFRRNFWLGLYNPDEALTDVSKYCRKTATKMGYRNPEEQ